MTSRLWRALGATEPLFQVITGNQELYDSDLVALTLVRGSDQVAGIHPAAASVTHRGSSLPLGSDSDLGVYLSGYGATLVADLGWTTFAQVQARWVGRVAAHTVSDVRDERATTTLTCNDWLSRLADIGTWPGPFTAGAEITDLYEAALGWDTSFGSPLPPLEAPVGMWDRIRTPPAPLTYADLGGLWTTEVGVAMLTTRANKVRVRNLTQLAATGASSTPTTGTELLTRRVCRSPVTWGTSFQPSQIIEAKLHDGIDPYVYPDPGGRPPISTTGSLSVVSHSRRHFEAITDTAHYAVDAEHERVNGLGYTIPEVTVSLRRLLSSPHAPDRRLAGQLLIMEQLEPVLLGYDWPAPVRGIHFAHTITETITRDDWTMTLGLVPDRLAVGTTLVAGDDLAGDTWATGRPYEETWDTVPDHDWTGA